MSAELVGYEWTRITTGQSGGAVYRLRGKPNSADLFLKHGRGAVAADIADEMVRLQWLANHLPVPAVRQFFWDIEGAWLLMTSLPGRTAYDLLRTNADDRLAIVDAIAEFLRRLHAIPVSECPFNSAFDYRLARARKRIDAGLVDEGDFDEEREGWDAEQVWTAMHQLLPFRPDRVVTHGDFSLDNLLVENGKVIGCIDVGRLGIADRYQDLAILWNGLGEFGERARDRFLTASGVASPDRSKLQLHVMLDELF
jgi:aminoglycoside 3'-phosphotransferase-1